MFNKTSPMTGFELRTSVSEATALPTEPQPLPWLERLIKLLSTNCRSPAVSDPQPDMEVAKTFDSDEKGEKKNFKYE